MAEELRFLLVAKKCCVKAMRRDSTAFLLVLGRGLEGQLVYAVGEGVPMGQKVACLIGLAEVISWVGAVEI